MEGQMIKFDYPDDATLLQPEEAEDLIPTHITTKNHLNEWEQENIISAEIWAFSRRHKDILNLFFLMRVHKKMFDKTWRFAGKFRKTEKNIGINPMHITPRLKILLDDIAYQIEHETFSRDEIAYRFHHRLVSIHPFPDGNGRHSRLMTDMLLVHLDRPRFTWGISNLVKEGPTRSIYIQSLKDADKGNYEALAKFVRS
jgi:Fic-DOC domain mobile mystery protein B